VFAIDEPITRANIPHLCEALRALVAGSGAAIVSCDVQALRPDAVTVEALARLQLTAVRLGSRVRLVHVSRELRELIDFMGLRAPMSAVSTNGAPAR
jgi:ABC-type transporter Mla MlaB component